MITKIIESQRKKHHFQPQGPRPPPSADTHRVHDVDHGAAASLHLVAELAVEAVVGHEDHLHEAGQLVRPEGPVQRPATHLHPQGKHRCGEERGIRYGVGGKRVALLILTVESQVCLFIGTAIKQNQNAFSLTLTTVVGKRSTMALNQL